MPSSRSDLVPSSCSAGAPAPTAVEGRQPGNQLLSEACLLNFPTAPAWLGVVPGAGTVGHCSRGGGKCIDGQVPLSSWQTLQVEWEAPQQGSN